MLCEDNDKNFINPKTMRMESEMKQNGNYTDDYITASLLMITTF